jgi:hypothetical protein
MEPDNARFRRLPRGRAGGAKIASRRDVNPRLTPLEAVDDKRFLALLRKRLGEPDPGGDRDYSYSVRDTEREIEFEAYCGQSGPAYGGSPPDHFVDFEANDNRTKPEVLQALSDFERWLEAAADAETSS